MTHQLRILFKLVVMPLYLFGCLKSAEFASTASNKYLYVSTGLCYAGIGFTVPAIGTVGKTVSRQNLSNLNVEIIRDYGDLSEEVAGTFVAGLVDGDDGYLYASVENATATGSRRIDKLEKTFQGVRSTWYQNSSVLTTANRSLSIASDGGFVLSRSTIVERFDSTPTRKMATATLAWGQTHAGSCATNNTLITDIISLPAYTGTSFGKYIYSHVAAGQNDIGIISMNGSIGAAECLANQQSTAAVLTNSSTANLGWDVVLSANSSPTSLVYIATPAPATTTGKLLVSYSTSALNTAAAGGLNNALVMYDINETSTSAATISNGQILYHDHQYFYGVTSMAYDEATASMYVATSNSFAAAPVGYNVEKFTIDTLTPSAVRVPNSNGSSFQSANSFNNCITDIFVGE